MNSFISALCIDNIRSLGQVSTSSSDRTWMVILVLCTYMISWFWGKTSSGSSSRSWRGALKLSTP